MPPPGVLPFLWCSCNRTLWPGHTQVNVQPVDTLLLAVREVRWWCSSCQVRYTWVLLVCLPCAVPDTILLGLLEQYLRRRLSAITVLVLVLRCFADLLLCAPSNRQNGRGGTTAGQRPLSHGSLCPPRAPHELAGPHYDLIIQYHGADYNWKHCYKPSRMSAQISRGLTRNFASLIHDWCKTDGFSQHTDAENVSFLIDPLKEYLFIKHS